MTKRKNGKARSKPKRKRPRRRRPNLKEVSHDELKKILERAKTEVLSSDDHEKLESAVDTLAWLTSELESKNVSLKRLKKLLFGSSSEKTKDVVGSGEGDAPCSDSDDVVGSSEGEPDDHGDAPSPDSDEGTKETESAPKKKKKRKGHGRRGAAEYTGATRNEVSHESLSHGDRCPGCEKGKVYRLPEPAVIVRIKGVSPLDAEVTELERLRCNLCGEVFTAKPPDGLGPKKYDETAAAMIGLLKYGCGFPFNRLERLGKDLGIPLPIGTQWDVVEEAAYSLMPVWMELVHLAAQGEVLHNDDTKARVLELNAQIVKELAKGETERTGIFTSGVVSTTGGRHIALFFTGREHAGENLGKVLKQREQELPPPIHMSDALERNLPEEFETIWANCLAHGRRHFVDVADNFPDEVRYVLEKLRAVYKNDAKARELSMNAEERLRFHQDNSGPLMDELEQWCNEQIDEKKVEPNSSLGGAILYMLNHWDELTLFLRVAGAPLDNNIAERILKKAILMRKNSLFYKTENGAFVGDIFMSLIHTAELCDANPFDYMVAIQRNKEAVAAAPWDWMPWNYEEALAAQT